MSTEYVILYRGVVVSTAENYDEMLREVFNHYMDSKAVREGDFAGLVSMQEAEISVYALIASAKIDLESYAKDWHETANLRE